MNEAILGRWFYIPVLGNRREGLKRRLTLMRPDLGYGKRKPIRMWDDQSRPGFLGIPRSFGLKSWNGPIRDETVIGRHFSLEAPPIPMRDSVQSRIVDRITKSWDIDEYGVIIDAPSDSGKTVAVLEAIRRIGQKAVVLTHKKILADQWKNSVKSFLNIDNSRVGLIDGESKTWDRNQLIVICSIQTIMSGAMGPGFEDQFSILVVDECHHCPHEAFSHAITRFPARLRVGLTATPKRSDGMERGFVYHIGPIQSFPSAVKLKPQVLFWTYKADWMDPDLFKRPDGEPDIPRILSFLSCDELRSRKLADLIVRFRKEGRTILMLSDRMIQIDSVKSLCSTELGEESIGQLTGKIAGKAITTDQRAAAKQCPVILATYGMMEDGVDVPELDCLIVGTPRKNMTQAIGRITRRLEGKSQPLIIDCVDALPICYGLWRSRVKNVYTGMEIEEVGLDQD